ncbi:MAG: hypothetical protein D6692_10685 [Planctomycetota bacterium]|nr:MAG: hypothetical protein D6692_10685 [Planctomycetota bacterium]
MDGAGTIMIAVLAALALPFLLAAVVYLFVTIFGLTWKVFRNIFHFIGAEFTDILRFIGALLSAVVFAPLVLLNIVIGRWSASKHFAGAFSSEIRSAGSCVYRLFVGNPARLLGLGSALEGVEKRVPQAMAAAPGRDKPSRRVGQFDGYKIVGSLQGGGSGGRLYIAEPDAIKRAAFSRNGIEDVDRVVIKAFSLKDGSSLPQIVRESRALDAAKKLGLVLEHELTPERFFYVMRYVPGDSLATVTQRLHAESSGDGLDNRRLATALGYAADLLVSLDAYHRAGLWHKDVKPDNIIVDGSDGRAHLVDFGLVTPLRSAMTLTTHGTEYFRDPELVRQALRGVKVHQIDGSRFDLYAAGAVLYSVIENSFPAHGGLSQISKRCPEALRWIIRRAMTDYDRRYASAAEMLADLRVVQNAEDPFKLKPVDLPSVSGQKSDDIPTPNPEAFMPPAGAAPAEPRRAASPVPPPVRAKGRPAITVSDWWTGRYSVVATSQGEHRPGPVPVPPTPVRHAVVPPEARRPAADQIRNARARARQRRLSARQRIDSRRRGRASYDNTPGAGTVFAALFGLAVLFGLGTIGYNLLRPADRSIVAVAPGAGVFAPDGSVLFSGDAGSVMVAPPAPVPPVRPEDLPSIKARLLVVSDLTLPLDDETASAVRRGLGVIEGSGAVLVGDLIDSGDSESVELVAELRRDRGRVPFDSDELAARSRAWLEGRSFDGVLFVAPDPDGDKEPQSLLVTQGFFTRLGWDLAPEHFVRVLAANGYVRDEGEPKRGKRGPGSPKPMPPDRTPRRPG